MKTSEKNMNECMTVVVPVYNRAHLIRRCLDSIYAQTYRPVCVIVVDNASTDSTVAEVKEWAESHVSDGFYFSLLSEKRQGAAYARQTGLDHTETEKVMFFDSDDAMRPECVGAVMNAWTANPKAEMVAWPITFRRNDGVSDTHSISGNLMERHLVHSIFRTQGCAVKTAYHRDIGGWRGEFSVWDDLETGVRLILNNPCVIPIDHSLVDVYPQAESITGLDFSSKHGKWEKSLDGIDCIIESSNRGDKARLQHIITYRRAVLAAFYAKEGHPELAAPLYRQALSEVPKTKRPLIRFAYHWTRLGMRGAFSIVGRFL